MKRWGSDLINPTLIHFLEDGEMSLCGSSIHKSRKFRYQAPFKGSKRCRTCDLQKNQTRKAVEEWAELTPLPTGSAMSEHMTHPYNVCAYSKTAHVYRKGHHSLDAARKDAFRVFHLSEHLYRVEILKSNAQPLGLAHTRGIRGSVVGQSAAQTAPTPRAWDSSCDMPRRSPRRTGRRFSTSR